MMAFKISCVKYGFAIFKISSKVKHLQLKFYFKNGRYFVFIIHEAWVVEILKRKTTWKTLMILFLNWFLLSLKDYDLKQKSLDGITKKDKTLVLD